MLFGHTLVLELIINVFGTSTTILWVGHTIYLLVLKNVEASKDGILA